MFRREPGDPLTESDFMLRSLLSVAIASISVVAFAEFPSLPEGVTSAGGATIGNHFYMYGGHTGPAHEYSVDMQSDAFRRLDLASNVEVGRAAVGSEAARTCPGGSQGTSLPHGRLHSRQQSR